MFVLIKYQLVTNANKLRFNNVSYFPLTLIKNPINQQNYHPSPLLPHHCSPLSNCTSLSLPCSYSLSAPYKLFSNPYKAFSLILMIKYQRNSFFYYCFFSYFLDFGQFIGRSCLQVGFYYLFKGFEICYSRLNVQQRLKYRSHAKFDHVLRSNIFFFPGLPGLLGDSKDFPTTTSSTEHCFNFNLFTPFFPNSLSSSPQLYFPRTQQQQCIAIRTITNTNDPAVTMSVIQYSGVSYHTSLNQQRFLIRIEWMKVINEAKDCMYTSPYINTMLEEGGMAAQMVGMQAMKASMSPMMEPMRSDRDWSWKQMPRLIRPRSHKGMKTVTREEEGNLYMGMLKYAYWKYLMSFLVTVSSLQSSGFFYFKNLSLSFKVISNSYALQIFTFVQAERANLTAKPYSPNVFYYPKDSFNQLSGWSMRLTLNVQLVYFSLKVMGWTVIQRIELMIQNGLRRRLPSRCTWKVFLTVNFTY